MDRLDHLRSSLQFLRKYRVELEAIAKDVDSQSADTLMTGGEVSCFRYRLSETLHWCNEAVLALGEEEQAVLVRKEEAQ